MGEGGEWSQPSVRAIAQHFRTSAGTFIFPSGRLSELDFVQALVEIAAGHELIV